MLLIAAGPAVVPALGGEIDAAIQLAFSIAELATAVAAAFIHDGKEVTYSFFHSWEQLRDFDAATAARIPRAGVFSTRAGTDGRGDARNMAARNFLAEP